MNMPNDYDLSTLSPTQQMQMRMIELDLEGKDIEHLKASVIYLSFKVFQTQNATREVVAKLVKQKGI